MMPLEDYADVGTIDAEDVGSREPVSFRGPSYPDPPASVAFDAVPISFCR